MFKINDHSTHLIAGHYLVDVNGSMAKLSMGSDGKVTAEFNEFCTIDLEYRDNAWYHANKQVSLSQNIKLSDGKLVCEQRISTIAVCGSTITLDNIKHTVIDVLCVDHNIEPWTDELDIKIAYTCVPRSLANAIILVSDTGRFRTIVVGDDNKSLVEITTNNGYDIVDFESDVLVYQER